MSPEITNGIFALIGVFIGALVTSIGTYATLRQQNRIWKKESLLNELRTRRDEIDELVGLMGELEINPDASIFVPRSSTARAAMYKIILRAQTDFTQPITPNSVPNLTIMLMALHTQREELDEKIDAVLNK